MTNPGQDDVDTEIHKYLLLPPTTSDALDWWKINHTSFPRLSKLARIILSIPATSAPSERAFSAAGNLITAKRSQIDPLRVKQILFIHDNYHLTSAETLRNSMTYVQQ